MVEDRIKMVQFNVKKEINEIKEELEDLKNQAPQVAVSAPTSVNLKALNKPQPSGDGGLLQEIEEARAYFKEVEKELSSSYDGLMS